MTVINSLRTMMTPLFMATAMEPMGELAGFVDAHIIARRPSRTPSGPTKSWPRAPGGQKCRRTRQPTLAVRN